ncbi:MAG TPA: glycosyltransferase [Cyclobacteriaceae bacterium]|nr:glycosyltransferase [Cyclobacteriaceae bacterium]
MSRKHVLVAPLDWGLGHATRCIPIIQAFQQRNCEVSIATSGPALLLLRKEFPQLRYFELVSYNVHYSKSISVVASIFWQLSKIRNAIAQEFTQLEKIVDENNFDLVVSDNRYGCWSTQVRSVFICHQLNLPMPRGFGWFRPFANSLHNRLIKKFNQVWIPDVPDEASLSGDMVITNEPSKYIGILSRFKKIQTELKYDVAVILSGPEPQRSILEEIIRKQLPQLTLRIILVRGVIENEIKWEKDSTIKIVNFLDSNQLEQVMNQSGTIVSRSGYSTIMDLATLGKKCILIPTPGQTEQEYLAKRLMSKGICYSISQQNFDLQVSLTASCSFKGFSNIAPESNLLSQALDDVLK